MWEIEQLAQELGIGPGELLLLAREVAMDTGLVSVDFLLGGESEQLQAELYDLRIAA